jgi:lysophospholipase L1-like esterase
MKLQRVPVFVIVASMLVAATVEAQQSFYLRDHDRVIFYGDSITEPRLYTTFVETYAVSRFPELRLEFVNSAWGGDRVTGGRGGPVDVRLQRDVIAYQPTVFALMMGMNDGWGQPFNEPLYTRYTTGYEHILDVITRALPRVRVSVMQPSPRDDITHPPAFPGGYNSVLIRYGAFVRQAGERRGFKVADLNTPLVDTLKKAQAIDPALARRIAGDGVHPGIAGHLVLAAALLKAWHAPALVSSVEIDGAVGRVLRAENTTLVDVKEGKTMTWTQADKALPFPINWSDPAIALAVRSSDVIEVLDQQTLEVSGLSGTRYALSIDGDEVGIFDQQQLQEGVNLAVLDTPMHRQAKRVHALTIERNEVQFGRWRQVQAALDGEDLPHKQAAVEAMDRLEHALWKAQHAAAQPQAHRFELAPQ